MSAFIWFGTLLGVALGFLHFLQFLLSRLGRPGTVVIGTIWQALWIWALWAVFGAYILLFWLIGLILYVVFGRSKAEAQVR